MALLVLFILIGIPVIEIYVFAEVGGIIGGWATVGLTLLTAALGALLFRSQGTAVLKRAQEQLRREETPLAEIIDGIGLLLAALFLFLPGFVTDAAGFLLFIPPLRVVLIGTDFEVRVWETLLRIPLGKATTYSDIAAHLGKPKAARAVGTAVGKNPVSFVVPCHRVLGKTGNLCGYHWGLTRKKAILGWEAGVTGAATE